MPTKEEIARGAKTTKQRKSENGSRDAAAPSQRRLRNSQRGGVDHADWVAADSALVRRAIAAVSARGCAIRFGYTRDGGAFCIGIVGDGDPYSEYVRPSEDINSYLTVLAEDFGG